MDEEKLTKLPDAELVALIREGFMPWIYAHLLSLRNIERLVCCSRSSCRPRLLERSPASEANHPGGHAAR